MTTRDKRVYEALAGYRHASIRAVAEQTGINRGSVYESLKALTAAGLVSHVVEGKTVRYVAENPEKLHEIINEKRRLLGEAHHAVDNYVQTLALEQPTLGGLSFASFYDGDEGLASILRDVLSTCRVQNVTEYCVIASPRVSAYLYNNFRHYTRERLKQKLRVRVLRQGQAGGDDVELAQWRMLPHTMASAGCYTIIYGTKVAIASIDAGNHAGGIIIDNADVARTHTALFNMAWQSAK